MRVIEADSLMSHWTPRCKRLCRVFGINGIQVAPGITDMAQFADTHVGHRSMREFRFKSISAGANAMIDRKFEAGEDAGKLVVTACRKLFAWKDKLTVYVKVNGDESSDQPALKKPRTNESDSDATGVRSLGTCTDALSAGEPRPQKEAKDSQSSEIALKKEPCVDASLGGDEFTEHLRRQKRRLPARPKPSESNEDEEFGEDGETEASFGGSRRKTRREESEDSHEADSVGDEEIDEELGEDVEEEDMEVDRA